MTDSEKRFESQEKYSLPCTQRDRQTFRRNKCLISTKTTLRFLCSVSRIFFFQGSADSASLWQSHLARQTTTSSATFATSVQLLCQVVYHLYLSSDRCLFPNILPSGRWKYRTGKCRTGIWRRTWKCRMSEVPVLKLPVYLLAYRLTYYL